MVKEGAVARGRKVVGKVAKGLGQPETVTAKVRLDLPTDTPTYFSNYLEITNTMHEFVLAGVRTPPKLSPDQMAEARETGALAMNAEFALVVPPTVVPGLIDALVKHRERYEATFGRILTKDKNDA
jgi:hypothetical protein